MYTHWEHWWLLLEWVGALSEIGDNWVSCWNNVRCISQMNDVAYFPRLIWCAFFIIYIAGSLNIWIEKLALVFLWVVWILLISDVIFLYFFLQPLIQYFKPCWCGNWLNQLWLSWGCLDATTEQNYPEISFQLKFSRHLWAVQLILWITFGITGSGRCHRCRCPNKQSSLTP